MILWGYWVPMHIDRNEKNIVDEEYNKDEHSMKTAMIFTVLTYALGYFYLLLPGFYLEYKGITNPRNDLCLGNQQIKDEIT